MVLSCRALVLALVIVLHAAFVPAADGKDKGKKKGRGSRSGGTMTTPAPPVRIGREGEYPIGGTWFFLGETLPDLLMAWRDGEGEKIRRKESWRRMVKGSSKIERGRDRRQAYHSWPHPTSLL